MAKTRKTKPPAVVCDLCYTEADQRCRTKSGKLLSRPHAVRLEAVRAARRDAKLDTARAMYQWELNGHYRIGPTPVVIHTDLLHLGVYSPDSINPAREHEAKLNEDGHIELTYLSKVQLHDGRFHVELSLDGHRFALPDKLARQVKQDMETLEEIARADEAAEQRAHAAARKAEQDSQDARCRNGRLGVPGECPMDCRGEVHKFDLGEFIRGARERGIYIGAEPETRD